MYKKKFYLKSGMRRAALAVLSGVFVLSLGLGAACSDTSDTGDDDSDETTSVADTQTILNGNFEFFDDSKDKTHIIYTPDNWTLGTDGRTNYVMNGIVDTSESGWGRISDPELAGKLTENDELDSDDENYEDLYVDYNGMRARDIPYANPHAALRDEAADADKTLIANPLTHDVITEGADGTATYVDENGETVTLYADEDGNYFTDEEKTEPYESHVLMVHNYVNSDLEVVSEEDAEYDYDSYGTAQNYTSSSTVTVEANTAAEISVWVKTAGLMYDRNGATPGADTGLGAYVSVTQTVGGNTVDSFFIDSINTDGITENNGWVQFTVFVNGCDFADSTVTVELGLGRASDEGDFSEVVEGYAFFDDLTCTKYADIEDSENYNAVSGELADTTCNLTDKDDGKVFGFNEHPDARYYMIDLSTGVAKADTGLGSGNVTVGLTEDDDRYVTSSSVPGFFNVAKKTQDNVHTNHNLDINTSSDAIGAFTLADLASQLSGAAEIGGMSKYANVITKALGNAGNLPGASEDATALMILSAEGAAYTAEISGSSFTVEANSYKIVSFWVKTSDMDGATAATIEIYDTADKDTLSSLTVDTTGETFDLGDEKDIYDGWVQCFFFVENPLDEQKTFAIDFSFGESTIMNTAIADYTPGYAAIANIQTTDIDDEDIFGLAATGSYAQSFSFEAVDNRADNNFDDVYGALSNNIESNISRPSSYNGANGASASIVYKDTIDPDGYDKRNANEYAGLINKDYFGDYITAAKENGERFAWLESLLESMGRDLSLIEAADGSEIWNEVFGETSMQPLLIVNAVRAIGETAAMNYGFIANSSTSVSSSSYQAVTVRVKVSAGAAAYVYLTDPDSRTEISAFDLPKYSFWYDSEGNVLDGEPQDDADYDERLHIVYRLRSDGLYEDKDGNLFANMYNYGREYYDERASYYAAGASEPTNFADLDEDIIYYISAEEAKKTDSDGNNIGEQSPHYLTAQNSDGTTTKVFRYENGEYRYIITTTDDEGNAEVTYSEQPVSNFKIGGEDGVALRYDNTDSARQLMAVVDGRYDADGNLFGGAASPEAAVIENLGYDADGNRVADTWQTVTFFVHTGDESEEFILELWSGERNYSGVISDGSGSFTADPEHGSVPGSFVVFDYSAVTVSEESFGNISGSYESDIIDAYIRLFDERGLTSEENMLASADENIAYFEELFDGFVAENKLSESDRPAGYDAMYYTYSLYDDAGYIPFNEDTAQDGETGYDYDPESYEETLVYLSYRDNATNTTSVFVDYSATKVTVSSGDTDDDTGDDEETPATNDTNVGLLAASIILAVALLFTLLSLFIRDLLKNRRSANARKHTERNVYSGKRKHYIRKLGLVEDGESGEADSAEDGNEITSEPEENETPAESEAQPDESAETPAEDGTESTEVPAEENSGEETPAENGDKADDEENK